MEIFLPPRYAMIDTLMLNKNDVKMRRVNK